MGPGDLHRSLASFLCRFRDPSMVARILLQPGDTVIIDNQRAMHGREAFKVRKSTLMYEETSSPKAECLVFSRHEIIWVLHIRKK